MPQIADFSCYTDPSYAYVVFSVSIHEGGGERKNPNTLTKNRTVTYHTSE